MDKASERVDVELHWVGGLVESHTLSRPVRRYDLQADYPRLVARLRAVLRRAAELRRRSPSGSTRRGSGRRSGPTASPGDGAAAACGTWAWPAASRTAASRAWAADEYRPAAWRAGWGSRGTRCDAGSAPAG